jgi:hypothetical protein
MTGDSLESDPVWKEQGDHHADNTGWTYADVTITGGSWQQVTSAE